MKRWWHVSSKVKLKTSALFSLHNGNFTPISLFDLKKNSVNYHHSTLSLRILFSELLAWPVSKWWLQVLRSLNGNKIWTDHEISRFVVVYSLRYHHFNPEYIHERLRQLGQRFDLRILLVQVDVVCQCYFYF